MKKLLVLAATVASVTCTAFANAEPTKMSDKQLSNVTAGTYSRTKTVAIASNNISSSASCYKGCVSVLVIANSIITQNATAVAVSK